MRDSLPYPPAPAFIPEDFTWPSREYRNRTRALLISLLLFLLFYILLLVGSAYLTYFVYANAPKALNLGKSQSNGLVFALWFGLLVIGPLLFLFLLKGFLKYQATESDSFVEVKKNDQPMLFEFIERLCEETSAPRPAKVYISHNVNAAVIYNTSLINLIVKPKKNLLIGAGLINAVNLTEFKATLAHEFGHFSQKTLSLGTYVYVVNRILRDIVYGRDKFDDFLNAWCAIDLRLSFPAWGLRGVIWVLRKGLGGVFRAINLIDLSLSRQMEFNADDVAVSVTGSDAIVHTLCRLEFADTCLNHAAHDLEVASQHGIYSDDLFLHQTCAAERIRKREKNPKLGLPPELPADTKSSPQVFDPAQGSDGTPEMWLSHPPNHEREKNAKRIYFRVEQDERSPWLLFEDPEKLKAKLTRRFYQFILKKKKSKEVTPATEVQEFIDAEHNEMTYDPRYFGLYDNRPLGIEKIGPLVQETREDKETWSQQTLLAFFNSFPGADLENQMKIYNQRLEDHRLLNGLKSGELELKKGFFNLDGKEYTMKDVPKLFDKVSKQIKEDDASLARLDKVVFQSHYLALTQIISPDDNSLLDDFLVRYRFQLTIQTMLNTLSERSQITLFTVDASMTGKELSAEDFAYLKDVIKTTRKVLNEELENAESLLSPALSNVAAGTKLIRLIWDADATVPKMPSGDTITGKFVSSLLDKLSSTIDRLRRLYFKNLGNLLLIQERIAKQWLERFGASKT